MFVINKTASMIAKYCKYVSAWSFLFFTPKKETKNKMQTRMQGISPMNINKQSTNVGTDVALKK